VTARPAMRRRNSAVLRQTARQYQLGHDVCSETTAARRLAWSLPGTRAAGTPVAGKRITSGFRRLDVNIRGGYSLPPAEQRVDQAG